MDHAHINLPPAHPTFKDYGPLALVISGIIVATVITCGYAGFSFENLLGYSMGYFFLVFGAFKLADLRTFAMGYAEYDLITKNLPVWGYMYPFVELGLGGLYLSGQSDWRVDTITLVLSAMTVVSVWLKLRKHETIHCVCLGNLLKVPLTYVSLVEYAVMGVMAIVMLAA
ncbi:MAG TPA: MauE/DoxX family redox-associated membrane protein [Magnetospirillaceae bacterium]|nr:MauE/DoxX family redox-associated membrane protein [Magnetospirillaceae bacterium]